MPINGSVGQSDYTKVKQHHFSVIANTLLNVSKGVFQKYPGIYEGYYLYVDLYAGSGDNTDNVPGSPIVFLESAKNAKVCTLPIFVEENEYSAKQLQDKLFSIGANHFKVKNINNKQLVEMMIQEPPRKKIHGLVYLDPNGIPDFDLLSRLSKVGQYSKVDFLINCPATAIKRAIGSKKCKQKSRLFEELETINKKNWIIREPIGKWQWTFIIGTNWDAFPKFKKHCFWPMDSDEGKKIINKLSYNAQELASMENCNGI